MTSLKTVLDEMWAVASEDHRVGMARFGIPIERAMGIPVPLLRKMARVYRNEHELAIELWNSGWHEARILAPMVADPKQTTSELVDRWTEEFDAWDICDQCCQNLFRLTPFAYDKVYEYALREEEFVRRTAFALMATLAVGDKAAEDERFLPFFGLIEQASGDSRNFVRKAVNWALRQIGKRNQRLHREALEVSRRLASMSDKTAVWIGKDALRELSDPKVMARIRP